jgi:hypothetical protein
VRWQRVVAVVMAALAFGAGACRDDGEGAATPAVTVRTELPTTTTTTDRYAVPAVIDAAYVNQVLASLDALTGEAFRLYMRDRKITPEITDRLKAAYGSGEAYDNRVQAFEAEKDIRLTAEPGNRITTVVRLISATPGCIFAQAARDLRPVGGTERDVVLWVGLRHPTASVDPAHYNPTPWILVIDGVRPDRSQPANPCAGS